MAMNIFAAIILFALFLDYVLGLVADLLNLKALKVSAPPELAGIHKPEEYRKSQEYIRQTTRLGFISGTLSLVLLMVFWFLGGFNYLDQIVRSWTSSSIVQGLIYIGILLLAVSLVSLPFGIYRTFVIEGHFGFNKTTPLTFFMDRVKGLGLGLLIGGPLLAGVLALFEFAGNLSWLYCWIAVTIFSFVVQYVAPNWIMPLFNKFSPMGPGDLREAILSYTRSVNFPLSNILVMDGSKRSSKSNAFFTGFGRNKRIALFDTLIAKHTVPELVSVLAHEVGHYKKRHIIQGTIIGIIHTGLVLYLLSLFLGSPGLYQAFHMDHPSVYAGLVFFGLLYTPVELVLSIVLRVLSRKNEYEADRFAALTIDDPHNLIDALKKLSSTNLSNLTPHPFYVFLNYSHPPLLQRIEAIQAVQKARSAPHAP
jgi:STE24 endopeptidase